MYDSRGTAVVRFRSRPASTGPLHNTRLKIAGLAGTRYFGDVDDYLAFRAAGARREQLDDLELMTHPMLDERGDLVDFHCVRAGERLEVLLADVEGLDEAVSYAGARF